MSYFGQVLKESAHGVDVLNENSKAMADLIRTFNVGDQSARDDFINAAIDQLGVERKYAVSYWQKNKLEAKGLAKDGSRTRIGKRLWAMLNSRGFVLQTVKGKVEKWKSPKGEIIDITVNGAMNVTIKAGHKNLTPNLLDVSKLSAQIDDLAVGVINESVDVLNENAMARDLISTFNAKWPGARGKFIAAAKEQGMKGTTAAAYWQRNKKYATATNLANAGKVGAAPTSNTVDKWEEAGFKRLSAGKYSKGSTQVSIIQNKPGSVAAFVEIGGGPKTRVSGATMTSVVNQTVELSSTMSDDNAAKITKMVAEIRSALRKSDLPGWSKARIAGGAIMSDLGTITVDSFDGNMYEVTINMGTRGTHTVQIMTADYIVDRIRDIVQSQSRATNSQTTTSGPADQIIGAYRQAIGDSSATPVKVARNKKSVIFDYQGYGIDISINDDGSFNVSIRKNPTHRKIANFRMNVAQSDIGSSINSLVAYEDKVSGKTTVPVSNPDFEPTVARQSLARAAANAISNKHGGIVVEDTKLSFKVSTNVGDFRLVMTEDGVYGELITGSTVQTTSTYTDSTKIVRELNKFAKSAPAPDVYADVVRALSSMDQLKMSRGSSGSFELEADPTAKVTATRTGTTVDVDLYRNSNLISSFMASSQLSIGDIKDRVSGMIEDYIKRQSKNQSTDRVVALGEDNVFKPSKKQIVDKMVKLGWYRLSLDHWTRQDGLEVQVTRKSNGMIRVASGNRGTEFENLSLLADTVDQYASDPFVDAGFKKESFGLYSRNGFKMEVNRQDGEIRVFDSSDELVFRFSHTNINLLVDKAVTATDDPSGGELTIQARVTQMINSLDGFTHDTKINGNDAWTVGKPGGSGSEIKLVVGTKNGVTTVYPSNNPDDGVAVSDSDSDAEIFRKVIRIQNQIKEDQRVIAQQRAIKASSTSDPMKTIVDEIAADDIDGDVREARYKAGDGLISLEAVVNALKKANYGPEAAQLQKKIDAIMNDPVFAAIGKYL